MNTSFVHLKGPLCDFFLMDKFDEVRMSLMHTKYRYYLNVSENKYGPKIIKSGGPIAQKSILFMLAHQIDKEPLYIHYDTVI